MDVEPESPHVYGIAVFLAFISLLIVILIIPPFTWHCRNHNTGAAMLVAWVIYSNFQSFLNAVIWPSDNIAAWYNGKGLCDIEVKLDGASSLAIPIAVVIVFRSLARVFKLDSTNLPLTGLQRRRATIRDVSICLIPALFNMLFQYFCQPIRYYIFGIAGCVASSDISWLSILLLWVPQLLVLAVGAYYGVLLAFRVYRYRANFDTILTNSQTNRSRFYRLYLLCALLILGIIPTQLYVLSQNTKAASYAYNWNATHAYIDVIIPVPSNGVVLYDRWIWMAEGICVFIFFGTGRDALEKYCDGLKAARLDKLLPFMRPKKSTVGSPSTTGSSKTLLGSFNEKIKSVLATKTGRGRGGSNSTTSSLASSGRDDNEMTSVTISGFK